MYADIFVIRRPRSMIMIDDFNALKHSKQRALLSRNKTCLQIISSVVDGKGEGRYVDGSHLQCNYGGKM